MKIGIFGSYNSGSLGDHAILEGIISQFEKIGTTFDIKVFAIDVVAIKELLSHNDSVEVTEGCPQYFAQLRTTNRGVQKMTEVQGSTFGYRTKRLVKRPRILLKLVQGIFQFVRIFNIDLGFFG